jgi:hypothetical protein
MISHLNAHFDPIDADMNMSLGVRSIDQFSPNVAIAHPDIVHSSALGKPLPIRPQLSAR